GRGALPEYARSHPHAAADYGPSNTIYAAAEGARARFGAGAFDGYDPRLVLTAPGATRSVWRLPAWFYPAPPRPPLSYHRDPSRWRSAGGHVTLETVAKGQEFVLDADHYPEAQTWVEHVVAAQSGRALAGQAAMLRGLTPPISRRRRCPRSRGRAASRSRPRG